MGKIILIASGKGGTGKTTAAANISAALGKSGRLTLAVDMDIGLRNLDIAFGLESSVVYDIFDVIEGRCTLDEAIIRDGRYENLYILSAPQTRDAFDADDEAFAALWNRLRDRFDYCVIDAPAGLHGGFGYALSGADMAVIVTVPEVCALRDADRAISVMEDNGKEDIRLVINRIRPDMVRKGILLSADDCVDMLQIPVLGIVPEDDALRAAAREGRLAVSVKESRAGEAFSNIARRINGEDVQIIEFGEGKTGFFDRLKKIFRAD